MLHSCRRPKVCSGASLRFVDGFCFGLMPSSNVIRQLRPALAANRCAKNPALSRVEPSLIQTAARIAKAETERPSVRREQLSFCDLKSELWLKLNRQHLPTFAVETAIAVTSDGLSSTPTVMVAPGSDRIFRAEDGCHGFWVISVGDSEFGYREMVGHCLLTHRMPQDSR